uniref:OSJNBb0013J13.7 protein n=2 Tax=Oryza TaxID=4527 RepID=Q7XP13_ORYSJ|nr:OSJNBb0013J13.7 [Oryza sativa Japonica Group]
MALQNLRLKYDSYKENNFNSLQDTKGSQSMKSALVTVLVVLLLITSSTALARKLAADDGQQKAESQAKSEVNIDGKPSSGYGEHVCPRDMYPNCFQRMKKLTSSNHLG